MTLIPIKKIRKRDPATGEKKEVFAVPSVAIATQQGRKLIPNPAGNEASLFDTLEEAEEAIRRAGFDYEFEGKKTYTYSQATPGPTPIARSSASPLEQSVPILIQQLGEREVSVVANAAFALGVLRAYAALETLAKLLGHDDPGVRKNVAEAMARMGVSALPHLRDAFEQARTSNHKNAPYIRLTVMSTFIEMLDQGGGAALCEQFLPLAITALEDESWLVRAQAALVVGRSAQALEEDRHRRTQQQQNFS